MAKKMQISIQEAVQQVLKEYDFIVNNQGQSDTILINSLGGGSSTVIWK